MNVEVKRRKGLFSTLGTQRSLAFVKQFEQSTGIQVPSAEKRDLASLARSIARFLSAARVLDTFDQPLPVSVHQLHCPRVPHATGKLKTVKSRTRAAQCQIEILGIGGSDSAELTFEAADSFETEAQCLEMLYSFGASWEHCEIATTDGTWRRFVRLKQVFPSRTSVEFRAIQDDRCVGNSVADSAEQVTIDLTSTTVPLQRTFVIRDEAVWTVKSKLEFPTVGVSVGTELRGKRKFETQWEFRLPPGFRYLAVRAQNPPTWIWPRGQSTP